ncbi:hypothetical protein HGP16_28315 [Rhizobium sp. P40RR-XXII]|uniref:hypothetical protein n=1 Tax=Rhizobium sp. P40RR-XXII TaxID=2726739 RepID=UPI0014568832|nr:hypothetical protein [Rhizobium sp. P40RR-XXII]NLS20437.1 hypothetical protein [Rhizobium sp. P40RR-XXII]
MRHQTALIIAAAIWLGLGADARAEDAASRALAGIKALWSSVTGQELPQNIAMSNDRIDAQQILISAKFAAGLHLRPISSPFLTLSFIAEPD